MHLNVHVFMCMCEGQNGGKGVCGCRCVCVCGGESQNPEDRNETFPSPVPPPHLNDWHPSTGPLPSARFYFPPSFHQHHLLRQHVFKSCLLLFPLG